jgi:hypothetical protein
MCKKSISRSRSTILAVLLGGSLVVWAQTSQDTAKASAGAQGTPPTAAAPASAPQPATPTATGQTPASASASRYRPNRFSKRAIQYYGVLWGVDSLAVKSVESGELIRFTYRVVDAQKAKVLNDKKSEPSLIDPRAGVKLVVPSLEKVGQLRQSSTPEVGKSYWMAFSNKGRLVKRGDRVIVVIGNFRADGLVVD